MTVAQILLFFVVRWSAKMMARLLSGFTSDVPVFFFNPVARDAATWGPVMLILANVVLAFVYTAYPWRFLFGTVALYFLICGAPAIKRTAS